MNVKKLTSILTFIENAIEFKVTPSTINGLKITLPVLEKLVNAQKRYENQFFGTPIVKVTEKGEKRAFPKLLFNKPDNEQWPGYFQQTRLISPQRIVSSGGYFNLLTSQDTYGLYKLLLFCHGVFIDPPFFAMPQKKEMEEGLLRAAKEDLIMYANIEQIIRQKIVIPVPLIISMFKMIYYEDDPWLLTEGSLRLPPKDEAAVRTVAKNIMQRRRGMSEKDAKLATIKALMSRAECNSCENLYDPFFFDNFDVADAFGEAILSIAKGVSSQDANASAMVQHLSTQFGINAHAVSMDDIVLMRENEEMFVSWRQILTELLDHMVRSEGRYNDAAKEFVELVKTRRYEFQDMAKRATGKGVLATMRDDAGDTVQCFVAGAITGYFIDQNKGPIIGGVSASVRPLLKMFGKLIKVRGTHHVRVSLNNHFLAIGHR